MAEEKKATEKKKDDAGKVEAKIEEKTKTEPKTEAKAERMGEKQKETSREAEKKAKVKGKKEEKKKEKVDIVSETIYTIPLKSAHESRPRYKRASKAVKFLLAYLARHTKSKDVKIEHNLNEHIWSRGPSKPPRRIQVKAAKDSKGRVVASVVK